MGITRAFFWSDVFLLKCAESYNATTVILDFDVISVVTGVKIATLLGTSGSSSSNHHDYSLLYPTCMA